MMELEWFKEKTLLMKQMYGKEQALDKAMLYTHPRFFLTTLHNELTNNNVEGYNPPDNAPNYEYIRGFLHREIHEKQAKT